LWPPALYENIDTLVVCQLKLELSRHRSEVKKSTDMASEWIDRPSEEELKEHEKKNIALSTNLRELNKMKLQLTESLFRG